MIETIMFLVYNPLGDYKKITGQLAISKILILLRYCSREVT